MKRDACSLFLILIQPTRLLRRLPVALGAFGLFTTLALASPPPVALTAIHSDHPIVLDESFDDPIWQKAPSFPLQVITRKGASSLPLQEGGTVKLAWDEHYLYVAASLIDSDVVVEQDADNVHHYNTGDVLELFLKPPGKRWYWEFYGTPNSRQTTFFFPSRGRTPLPSCLAVIPQIKVAARVKGTMNNWRDFDEGWSIVMAIPVDRLTALGDLFTPDSPPWKILVARYNYSAYLEVPGGELSATSPLGGGADFHCYEEWNELHVAKASH